MLSVYCYFENKVVTTMTVRPLADRPYGGGGALAKAVGLRMFMASLQPICSQTCMVKAHYYDSLVAIVAYFGP